jgi:hypothetical protein
VARRNAGQLRDGAQRHPQLRQPRRRQETGRALDIFSLTGLFGAQLLRVSGQAAGWTLKAVYVNGRDVTDTPFTIDGLPPGEYLACALEESPFGLDLLDPEVVKRLRKAATRFSLKEGETRTLALTVMSRR